MTSAELARCSSTSEATVTRFCKNLRFENNRAFQLALARDVMERSPLEIPRSAVENIRGPEEFLSIRYYMTHITELTETAVMTSKAN